MKKGPQKKNKTASPGIDFALALGLLFDGDKVD
jgi:hypothetical protein